VGMDSNAEDFLQGLKLVGIPADRLKAILLTHWHNDHAAGAAFLKRDFGVRVYYDFGRHAFSDEEDCYPRHPRLVRQAHS